MSTSSVSRDHIRFDELAEEFAERFRRAEAFLREAAELIEGKPVQPKP